MRSLYQAKTALAVSKFKRDKYNQWLAKRIIIPAKLPLRSGDRSGFSFDNLVQFLLVNRLADFGINIVTAGAIARSATDQFDYFGDGKGSLPTGKEKSFLLINVNDHNDIMLANTPAAAMDIWPAYIVVDLLPFYRTTEERINEMGDDEE